jgi:hypothetical protein
MRYSDTKRAHVAVAALVLLLPSAVMRVIVALGESRFADYKKVEIIVETMIFLFTNIPLILVKRIVGPIIAIQNCFCYADKPGCHKPIRSLCAR